MRTHNNNKGKRRPTAARGTDGLTTAFGKEIPRDALAGALAHCGFSENVRGEELGLEEFARLTEELSALL